MSNDNVIDFGTRMNTPKETVEAPKPKEGRFEFTMYSSVEDNEPDTVTAEGFLKFGPSFIAVTEGPEDTSNVVFFVQTNMVKSGRRLKEDQVETIKTGKVKPKAKK